MAGVVGPVIVGRLRHIDVQEEQRIQQALSETGFKLPVLRVGGAAFIEVAGGFPVVFELIIAQRFIELVELALVVAQGMVIKNLDLSYFSLCNDTSYFE